MERQLIRQLQRSDKDNYKQDLEKYSGSCIQQMYNGNRAIDMGHEFGRRM